MSREYWKEREYYNLLKSKRNNDRYVKEQIGSIYNDLLLKLEVEISNQVYRFANYEGVSIEEARKRISKADVDYYKTLAKDYVDSKDFTEKANHEMKLYNVTMRLNRLEYLYMLLRSHIIDSGSKLEKSLTEHLVQTSLEEYKRQAGILNLSLSETDILRKAKFIASQDYYNAHFSDRIWRDSKELSRRVEKNIGQVVIQGKNPKDFAKKLKDLVKDDLVSVRHATERLAFTEAGRVWIQTQIDAYKEGGYKYLEILTEPTACSKCQPHNGDIVRIDEVREGDNVPLWHPRCRCTTVAYEVDDSVNKSDSGYNDSEDIEIGFTSKQIGKKIGEHCIDYGLNPSSEEDREKFIEITKDIVKNHDESFEVDNWRGQKESIVAYLKEKDVVLLTKSYDYITTMKGGVNNARIKSARNKNKRK